MLIEAAPDFVGLSDLAEMVGISRQAMRKLMLAHAGDFPPPVHEGTQAIWHLAEVLDWLEARGRHSIAPELLETASMTRTLNVARERDRAVQHRVGFLYHYVARLGLLEGQPGLIACQIRSSYIAQVRAKMVELKLQAAQAQSQVPTR